MNTILRTALGSALTVGATTLALAPLLAFVPATQATPLSPAHVTRTDVTQARKTTGPSDSVATIRAATAKYHDVNVALADGYLPTEHCVASPAGAMGFHYVNPALVAGPVDLRRPSVLLYLPSVEGPKLAGVEWVSVDADQDTSTDADRPALLGVPFEGPMPGHEPGEPVHYDLHAWVWKNNPAGMFAGFNPAASC